MLCFLPKKAISIKNPFSKKGKKLLLLFLCSMRIQWENLFVYFPQKRFPQTAKANAEEADRPILSEGKKSRSVGRPTSSRRRSAQRRACPEKKKKTVSGRWEREREGKQRNMEREQEGAMYEEKEKEKQNGKKTEQKSQRSRRREESKRKRNKRQLHVRLPLTLAPSRAALLPARYLAPPREPFGTSPPHRDDVVAKNIRKVTLKKTAEISNLKLHCGFVQQNLIPQRGNLLRRSTNLKR